MKRYSLKFKVLDQTLTADGLRTAVDDFLLRLSPPVTYRLGRAAFGDTQTAVVEIATDGKKELFAQRLKALEQRLPVTLEGVGWGWQIAAPVPLPETTMQALTGDSLADIEPCSGQASFQLIKRSFWLRYLFFLFLTLLAPFTLIIGKYLVCASGVSAWIYLIVLFTWYFLFLDLPLDIRQYVEKIVLEPDGVTLIYWFRGKTIHLAWEEIWGLEFNVQVCTILGKGKPVRLLLGERTGFKERKLVLKTIVQRAGLSFVEMNFWRNVYKRHNAP